MFYLPTFTVILTFGTIMLENIKKQFDKFKFKNRNNIYIGIFYWPLLPGHKINTMLL